MRYETILEITASGDRRSDAMTLGFLIAGFAWTVWWNIDWQRFIKFYGVTGPPYRLWIATAFRIFFALCSLGAVGEILRRLVERARPAKFYLSAFVIAVAWFVAIVLMVKAVEWLGLDGEPCSALNDCAASGILLPCHSESKPGQPPPKSPQLSLWRMR